MYVLLGELVSAVLPDNHPSMILGKILTYALTRSVLDTAPPNTEYLLPPTLHQRYLRNRIRFSQSPSPHSSTQRLETVSRTYQILKFLDTRTANNGRSDPCQRPRQRNLRHAYAAFLGYLFNPNRIIVKHSVVSQTQTERRTF
jgi:hypothetical protein